MKKLIVSAFSVLMLVCLFATPVGAYDWTAGVDYAHDHVYSRNKIFQISVTWTVQITCHSVCMHVDTKWKEIGCVRQGK